jgi:hypothetical protein
MAAANKASVQTPPDAVVPKAQPPHGPAASIRSRIKLPWLSGITASDRMPGSYNTNEFSGQKGPAPLTEKDFTPAQLTESALETQKASSAKVEPPSLAPHPSAATPVNDPLEKPAVVYKPQYQKDRSMQQDTSAIVRRISGSESHSSTVSDPFKDRPSTDSSVTGAKHSVAGQVDPVVRAYSSTQSLARVLAKPRIRQRSTSMISQSEKQQNAAIDLESARRDCVDRRSLSGRYTPSTYDSTPPSERNMPSSLPRKDPASYERLIRMSPPGVPFKIAAPRVLEINDSSVSTKAASPAPEKSPTWPMVPLSELELDVPIRVSSLGTSRPRSRSQSQVSDPSNMERYNDGTLSRKPTVRAAVTFRSPDVSPKTQSPPSSSSTDKERKNLERAVTGLHNLMEEALTVAQDAAHNNRTEEVAQILDEAKIALRKSSTVHGQLTSPLRIDDSETTDEYFTSDGDYSQGSDSDADIESNVSSLQPKVKASNDTIPTAYTKSKSGLSLTMIPPRYSAPVRGPSIVHPIVSPPFEKDGTRPTSQQAAAVWPSSSESFSMTQTPPQMYSKPSKDSAVQDWAYARRQSTRRDLRGGTELGPVGHEDTVLPPPPGERASVVLPPIISQDASVRTPEQLPYEPLRISIPDVPQRRSLRPVHSDPQLSTTSTPTPRAATGPVNYDPAHYVTSDYPPARYSAPNQPEVSGPPSAPAKR